MSRPTIDERFVAKVMPVLDGCHLWTAYISDKGYGQFRANGKMIMAHRFAYERANGKIPQGMYIDHKCRVRSCVNPAHLRVVTPRQNVLENSIGTAAINAVKTHCPQQHPFDETNTWRYSNAWRYPNGKRNCRECGLSRARAAHRIRRLGEKYMAEHQLTLWEVA